MFLKCRITTEHSFANGTAGSKSSSQFSYFGFWESLETVVANTHNNNCFISWSLFYPFSILTWTTHKRLNHTVFLLRTSEVAKTKTSLVRYSSRIRFAMILKYFWGFNPKKNIYKAPRVLYILKLSCISNLALRSPLSIVGPDKAKGLMVKGH